ncbi:MAG: T9SS type A sorting domain-containing protein [Flavobacteriales bacterium]
MVFENCSDIDSVTFTAYAIPLDTQHINYIYALYKDGNAIMCKSYDCLLECDDSTCGEIKKEFKVPGKEGDYSVELFTTQYDCSNNDSAEKERFCNGGNFSCPPIGVQDYSFDDTCYAGSGLSNTSTSGTISIIKDFDPECDCDLPKNKNISCPTVYDFHSIASYYLGQARNKTVFNCYIDDDFTEIIGGDRVVLDDGTKIVTGADFHAHNECKSTKSQNTNNSEQDGKTVENSDMNNGTKGIIDSSNSGKSTSVSLKVEIFPNPVSEFLHFKFTNFNYPVTVSVYDSKGTFVESFSFRKRNVSINVDSFDNGVYFCKIYNKNQLLNKKVVIK